MPRDPRHDILFEPVRIGPKTLRNRFYQTPHCTGFGVAKPRTQAAFRGMKAEGGWAAVNTEYCSISPESDDSPHITARLWDDEDARLLSLMVEEAHRHGALAGVQLWHGGVYAVNHESRLPTIAPTSMQSSFDPLVVARPMTLADIDRVQQQWAAAARRARAAGFDIVYVYGSHNYLGTQFLSPRFNRRTDAYGGSFENRCRFWLEAIELVREAVGDDCAVAVRIAADGLALSGVEAAEGRAFIAAADHLVDLWDLSAGGLWGAVRVDAAASRFERQGYQLPFTDELRGATRKPVIGVGRFTDPDVMAEIVRSGRLDLIGAARPSIADPFLPRKIEEGRYDEIRECIGCNACYARAVFTGHLGCTQNATAGEEHRRGWHPERFQPAERADRDVLVVGGGPAGLEFAHVAARRGFRRVHVVEAGPELGGHLRWLTRLPGFGEWGRVVAWRRTQLERLRNVTVVLGERLTADAIRAYGAELVVVATGAVWCEDGTSGMDGLPIPGADATLPWVLTPEQVMGGKEVPGDRVAVVDYDGYLVGAGIAEHLALAGHRVELVTPFDRVAPTCDETIEGHRLRLRLRERGVKAIRGTSVLRLEPGVAHCAREHGEELELAVDAVVLVTLRRPATALRDELRSDPDALTSEGIEGVYEIGDAVAPRLLADAIFDGHRLGRELDGPHPEMALPYLRG